jgi:hypothetical protein
VRRCFDDLPAVSVSPMRAAGVISADTTSTFIRFGESEFSVGVTHRRFPNGGDWALFACPACPHRGRKLWLLDGAPRCWHCCRARGVAVRAWSRRPWRRAEISVSRLLARLESKTPARLHPRPDGSMLDRRRQLENSLRLAQLVLKHHRLKGVAAALARAKKGE